MASRRRMVAVPLTLLGFAALGSAVYLWRSGAPPAAPPPALPAAEMMTLYAVPSAPPAGKVRGFHIGHSLVARDMPAMLAQLASGDYAYESQLGWGTPLRAHWDPEEKINGFDAENNHARYRDAYDAVDSGDYDALILTEMVEIRDAIAYFQSWEYLQKWSDRARSAQPDIRVFFYETWPDTDDTDGWLNRLDLDLNRYWLDGILRPALAESDFKSAIHVIPGGQVMAAFLRAVEANGGAPDVASVDDLMSDTIHFNDLGAYLMALTHYAVIFGRSPEGLPHMLNKSDGTAATAPSAETAALMQKVVWDVVTSTPLTGVVGTDTAPLVLSEGKVSP